MTLSMASIAQQQALKLKVDPRMVCAIIEKESSWDSWAWNPEPKYRYLWDFDSHKPFRKLSVTELNDENPPLDFSAPRGVPRDAEWWGQQASWGLMQVMGAVARERGFRGHFLSELCDPATGIYYGCLQIFHFSRMFKNDEVKIIAAFNGGPGAVLNREIPINFETYVKPVLSYMGRY